MHKEKFFLIIIKLNQMNKYFGEGVFFYILLKSALIRVYRAVLHQVKHSLITAFTMALSLSPSLNKTKTGFYEVWQKSNATDFLLTMNFILFQIAVIPFKIVPLGSYTATEALFPLFVAVLEVFCWNTFQLVGYAMWILSKVPKWRPVKWFLSRGNKKNSQRLRCGEYGG
jgi:hypothetical protein